MKVVFTRSAFGDLESIQAYYSEEGVPDVGKRFQREIIERVQQLDAHPDLGRVVPEFETITIRELIHPPFRIVYLREETAVHVVRIWRSERQLALPDDEGSDSL